MHLNLTHTASLVRLHQYHDAHTVHKALVRLQPVEETAFLAEYNAQVGALGILRRRPRVLLPEYSCRARKQKPIHQGKIGLIRARFQILRSANFHSPMGIHFFRVIYERTYEHHTLLHAVPLC